MSSRCARLSALLLRADVRPAEFVGGDPWIRGICIDSRKAAAGSLFVALSGEKTDGNRFVPQAVAAGAVAVVSTVERPDTLPPEVAWVRVADARRTVGRIAREWHGCPDESLVLVGVTGTNGKTTVVHLVEAIARTCGMTPGRIGTVGYAHGGREHPAERTTPEATDFYALLESMVLDGCDLAVMEVSSHALALGRVEGARFAVGAFLNLGRDHLDFHGTTEAYFAAKARLIEGLGPTQAAVLPAADPRGESLAAATRARVLTFGRSESADVRIREEHLDLGGSRARIETPTGPVSVRSRLVGRFNLDNLAAAAACAVAVGLPADGIAEGIASFTGVPGRLERVDAGQPFVILVDYAHTEAALTLMLSAIREVCGKARILLVFGCGGDRDRGKRPGMGRAAASGADLVFLTSDNPRHEDPRAILREIETGIASITGGLERCRVLPDRREAVRAAVNEARPGDVVIVAGKGHETTQTVGDRIEPMDDRDLARSAVGALAGGGGPRAGA